MFTGRVIVKSVLRRAVVACSVSKTVVVPSVAIFKNVNTSRTSTFRSFMTSAVASKGTSVYVGNLPFDLDEVKLTALLGDSVTGYD